MKKLQSQSSIRIIGGDLRSRKIHFPEQQDLRPSADRVRETLFNWLQLDMPGSHCLDLFAGSGVLGIESISRGASAVTFVENNSQAAHAIRENLNQLELESGNVECIDALRWLEARKKTDGKYDVVFLDPPFAQDITAAACELLEKMNMLSVGCKIYVETGENNKPITFPPSWREIKRKKAGRVSFCLMIKEALT